MLHQIAIAAVTYGLFKLPRIRRRPCAYIFSMLFVLVRANLSSPPSSYYLNVPPAGNIYYLPLNNNPIH